MLHRVKRCEACSELPNADGVGESGYCTMDYTSGEMMVVTAARFIRDGDVVFVGMRVPLLAFLLAKATHAPGAVGLFENGVIRDIPAQEPIVTMGDPPNLAGALKCTDMMEIMGILQQGKVDLGMIGGAQVDRFGNLNTTWIGPENNRRTRLPGSGGAADIACLSRRFIVIMAHEKRRLVEKVDYITSPGYGTGGEWRQQEGLIGGGPKAIITTLGVLQFDPFFREAVLSRIHPGVTIEQVRSRTGWEIKSSPDVPTTALPSQRELEIIRSFDPQGFWTG